MATMLTAALPRDEFALREALSDVPEATFEVEEIVETADEAVMPLVWAEAADQERLEAAIRADPTTEDVELLSEFGRRWLYRMEWVSHVRLLLRMITTNSATVLEARTTDNERWFLRVMYPQHNGISDTKAYCEKHNVTLNIRSIREMEGTLAGRYGLTDEQYEALTTAYNEGYFNIPREVDLDDLAQELDISHQALSERIRRAHAALIADTLLIDPDGDH